jgi:hypothetical protein
MQSGLHGNKLFSFDGRNINFYLAHSNGELRLADDQFSELKTNSCNRSNSAYVAEEEHANVGDISFQTFFKGLCPDHQKLVEQKLTQTGLANFRRVNAGGSEQLLVDLNVGSQKIRAGMIVALGGYFGLPDEPISCDIASTAGKVLTPAELRRRFLAAFQTLLSASMEEVSEITKQIGWEGNTIHGLIKRKAQPSIVMGAVKQGKIIWANLTSRSLGWKKHIPGGFFIGRYMQAATMNFDHFGLEAETAYEVGHRLALQMAAAASVLPDEDDNKWQKLVEALSLELFACHFFADLFVSGHTRTPRKKVFEVLNNTGVIKKKWIAALFANLMHDEDNEKGVYVCSENQPVPWEAMGDYRYSDDDSSDKGEVYAQHAVAARLNELYQVFRKKKDWAVIAAAFKRDIPKEATPQWLDYCKCNDVEARDRALKHAQKFKPFLRVGIDGQLEASPDYSPITKKEIMLLLADMLAQGIVGEVKEIVDGSIKEITRITSLAAKGTAVVNAALKSAEINPMEPKCSTKFADDSLQQKILEELYLMDDADEIIVGIEMPPQDKDRDFVTL